MKNLIFLGVLSFVFSQQLGVAWDEPAQPSDEELRKAGMLASEPYQPSDEELRKAGMLASEPAATINPKVLNGHQETEVQSIIRALQSVTPDKVLKRLNAKEKRLQAKQIKIIKRSPDSAYKAYLQILNGAHPGVVQNKIKFLRDNCPDCPIEYFAKQFYWESVAGTAK